MNRRNFLKFVGFAIPAAVGLMETVNAEEVKETGLTTKHKLITNVANLEPGRIYYLKGIDGSSFQDGFATCIEYQSSKYFHQRIWADKGNNQAMKRWDIYETSIIDSSYYSGKGEDDYRKEYLSFERMMLGRTRETA